MNITTRLSSGLRHFYSSKIKGKTKKEKEEKGLLSDIFCLMFSCWLNIAGILKREKSEKKKKNCFVNLNIFV